MEERYKKYLEKAKSVSMNLWVSLLSDHISLTSQNIVHVQRLFTQRAVRRRSRTAKTTVYLYVGNKWQSSP